MVVTNMNKILALLMFGFIFLAVPLVSADTITIPYKNEYDLKRPCFNNGTFCSASATCNLTLVSPEGNAVVDNQLMTNQVSFHNYTLSQDDTDKFGSHPAIMSCTDGSDSGSDTFTVKVTGDGADDEIFPTQFFLAIIGIILVIVGKLRDDMSMMQHLGGMALMVFGVVTLYPGYSGINYDTLFGLILGVGSAGMGFYFLIERSLSLDDQQRSFR